MIENPKLFPIIEELTDHINKSKIKEKEKFLKYQFQYMGLKFVCIKLVQDARFLLIGSNDRNFQNNIEKTIIKSVLTIYVKTLVFNKDFNVWNDMLIKENLQ